MGLADAFGSEDRVLVKISDFYKLMRESAKCEIAMNCIQNDVPNEWARKVFNLEESGLENGKDN